VTEAIATACLFGALFWVVQRIGRYARFVLANMERRAEAKHAAEMEVLHEQRAYWRASVRAQADRVELLDLPQLGTDDDGGPN
jgi:hypothetical protein